MSTLREAASDDDEEEFHSGDDEESIISTEEEDEDDIPVCSGAADIKSVDELRDEASKGASSVPACLTPESTAEERGVKVDDGQGSENEQDDDGSDEELEGEEEAALVGGVTDFKQEKKELQPYEVPTSGAFYMHDNRGGDDAKFR